MAQPPLAQALVDQAVEAWQIHRNVTAAAKALGWPRTTLQHRLAVAAARRDAPPRRSDLMAPPREPLPAFEDAWRVWSHQIGMATDRYQGPKTKPRGRHIKILVIPDIHAPFHDPAAVAAMLARDGDADIAVLMGDIGDSYSLSRFLKYEAVPYEDELAAVTLLMQTFSERFPIVRVITGNHDGPRLEKQILERLTGDMVAAIRSMTGGTLDPIEVLCRRFPNCERVTPKADRHPLRWMTQIGDALFLHAEKYSRVPGSALRSIDEWITDFEALIAVEPYRVIVQAHTHTQLLLPWKSNRMLVECGTLAKAQGYQFTARLGGRPQRTGYVTLEQTDGHTDMNSIRLVWLDGTLR